MYDSGNRQLLDRVKDDSSSLIVLRDAASSCSRETDSTVSSSIFARVFPGLDNELMGTQVYQKAVRSLFRNRNKRTQDIHGLSAFMPPPRQPNSPASRLIDRQIKADKENMRQEIQMALIGGYQSATQPLMATLHSHCHPYTQDECNEAKPEVARRVRSILDLMVKQHLRNEMSPLYEKLDKTYAKLGDVLNTQFQLGAELPDLWQTIAGSLDREWIGDFIWPHST